MKNIFIFYWYNAFLIIHAIKELKKFEILSFVAVFWLPCSFLEQLEDYGFPLQLASKKFYLMKILEKK